MNWFHILLLGLQSLFADGLSVSVKCCIDFRKTTTWKVSKYGVISGQNTGKYGPEITPYLDTFHAVNSENTGILSPPSFAGKDSSFLSETVVQRCSVKKRLWHRCFLLDFMKFQRTFFFTEHLWTTASFLSKFDGVIPPIMDGINSVDTTWSDLWSNGDLPGWFSYKM